MLARQSTLVLKVGLSYGIKMAMCIASYNQGRLRYGRISHLHGRFSHPSVLTRRSALVLKVGVSYRWQSI